MFLGRTDIEGFVLKYTLYLCSLYLFLLSFLRTGCWKAGEREGVILSGGSTCFFPAPDLKLEQDPISQSIGKLPISGKEVVMG